MNQIRIGTLAGKGNSTDTYIKSILHHGFESFQINFWQELGDVDLVELAPRVEEALGDSGAIISSLGVFGNPLGTESVDEQTVRAFETAIDHAHLFGTNLVAGFTGRVRNQPIPDSIPKFKQVFGELAQRASDKGVRLAFENCAMNGNWLSGDWNIAHSPDAWELMFDALPNENLGLEWEPCHQILLLIDPLPQLRKWVDKIFHVHGKDATLYHDIIREKGIGKPDGFGHHRHPGFGDTNWTDVISELRLGGYTGTIDIEGWHDPVYKDDWEMTGQVHALNYLKRCRGGEFVKNP